LIRLIINIEAQGDFHPGYPLTKRELYYCCRMISAQYSTEFVDSNYQDMKKVYSIWIAIKPPLERQNTITRYRIVEENMVGSVKEPVRNYDLMTLLMICLGRPENTKCDILKLLDMLLSNEIAATEKQRILQNDVGIPMTRELEGGQRLREKARHDETQALHHAWQEGKQESISERNIEIARNVLQMNMVIDDITKLTGLAW